MFKKIVEFFTGKKTAPEVVAPGGAPYKVEPPAATTPIPSVPANEPPKCGCGRSATGYCVGLHKLSPEAWATSTSNPDFVTKVVVPDPVKKPRKPAVKKPAEPKVVAKPKPAAIKAPAKPRAKKTPQ